MFQLFKVFSFLCYSTNILCCNSIILEECLIGFVPKHLFFLCVEGGAAFCWLSTVSVNQIWSTVFVSAVVRSALLE